MRFSLIHVPNDLAQPCEEVMLTVPGGARTVIAFPLDALPKFLPLVHQATESLGEQRCPSCDEPLPGLRHSEVDDA
jgi:hypothetical protein